MITVKYETDTAKHATTFSTENTQFWNLLQSLHDRKISYTVTFKEKK